MQEKTLAELHARLDQCKENLTNPEIVNSPELLEKLNERIAAYKSKIAEFDKPAPDAGMLKDKPEVAAILQSKAAKHEKNYRLHLLGITNEEISSLTGSPKNAVGRDIGYYKKGQKRLG